MMKYWKILSFFLFYLPCLSGKSITDFQSGLTFKAHSFNQDERTGLDLTPDTPFKLGESFGLEFKMKHLKQNHTYGYVFRLIANDTIHLDMVTNLNGSKINFIVGNKLNVQSNIEFLQTPTLDQWLDIQVTMTKDSLQFYINKKKKTIRNPYPQIKTIQVLFGQNKHPLYFTTDVAPMTIKEVSITSGKGKKYYWDMWKHRNNEVYDAISEQKGTVTNGVWEIDKHIKWQKEFSQKLPSLNPQIAHDEVNDRVFVVYNTQILEINLVSKASRLIDVSEGRPFIGVGCQLMYDKTTNKLLSYSIEQKAVTEYDFSLNRWSEAKIQEQLYNQHHNQYFDQKRQKLILFGGYGSHRYNSIITQLDLNSGHWSEKDLSAVITPRYLSAMGKIDDDNILIMGGYGSKTGKQEESPINYYDLYKYNIETGKCSKLFEFANETLEHFTFSNSLIVEKNNVYALKYNNDRFKSSINLFKLDLDTQKAYIWKDSILYNFLDIESFSDLVFCEKTSELYAIVIQKAEYNSSIVDVYSIKFPPFEDSEVLQDINNKALMKWQYILPIVSIILAICVGAFIVYLRRRRKTEINEPKSIPSTSDITRMQTFREKDKVCSAIYLLGGFQTYSKTGEDITVMSSPVIRQLFLCILLHTIKNGKGISSDLLNEIFWFDMEYKNALNNRRVNISKLRLILKDIGDIEVLNTNSYWYIDIGNEVFCDYYIIMKLLNETKEDGKFEVDKIRSIVDIAAKGPLLPNIQNEWTDTFKSEYSGLLVDILLSASEDKNIKEDTKFLIDIANVILLQDSIDENGIRIKCRCLYQLGQKGLSKQTYDKFCMDYKKLLGVDPDLKYEDIILN